MRITPKNWADFQHYKDRSPIWIKLHRKLLDDYRFHGLPVASRALAPMLWLLASEYEGGTIDATESELAFRLRMNDKDFCDALKPLLEEGFFISDSKPLARRKRKSIPEKETEKQVREETEKNLSRALRAEFDEKFWPICPRKVEKDDALKAFVKARKSVDLETLVSAMRLYARSRSGEDPKYTKHPSRWLNAGCWKDESPKLAAANGSTGPPAKTLDEIIAAARTLDEKPPDVHKQH